MLNGNREHYAYAYAGLSLFEKSTSFTPTGWLVVAKPQLALVIS